jgi:hypothetical protein
MAMPTPKNQSRERARKRKTRVRVKPRRRAGSRVGDDLVAAFEEMAAHLRGEIELEDVARLIRPPTAKQTTPSS